jgi:hypothetical protein
MNADRRRRINEAMNTISEVISDLEDIRDDEDEAYNGMPENLQNSERGENSQDAIGALEAAIESLSEIDGCYVTATEPGDNLPPPSAFGNEVSV